MLNCKLNGLCARSLLRFTSGCLFTSVAAPGANVPYVELGEEKMIFQLMYKNFPGFL